MMKEYFPADYAKVKKYVAAGRWFPAGSSMEENDVNSPSAESIIRQVLYGKQYFRREFGKTSAEYMLPDCFGFPASLPSILAHAGIKGFSTQKLTWGSSAPAGGPNSPEKTPLGTPFNVGIWEGPDGKSVIAALNPGDYSASITTDLSVSPDQSRPAARRLARTSPVGWRGERRCSPIITTTAPATSAALPTKPRSNCWRRSSAKAGGPLHVVSATADQMFLDIKPDQTARLPRYKGDLELTNHSAGSLTSEAYLKRWNRKNELLADAAEKASVAAELLGGRPYPLERLNNAWTLVMGGQFHDIMPGTSTPKAYEFSWNDEVLAMNQFAGVLASATEAVASGMDTQAKGAAIVVYNPLNVAREDVVEAAVAFPGGTPKAVRVIGPDGKEVPAQLSNGKVLFVAKAPSVGYAVYDVEPAETPAAGSDAQSDRVVARERALSRHDRPERRHRQHLRQDRQEGSALRLRRAWQSRPTSPCNGPPGTWIGKTSREPPRAYVGGPAQIRIVENGPARVALEVSRETEGSKFVQTIRLAAGDAGNRVEFGNVIDWNTKESHLKAVFPLTATNPVATYNWDIGTIERGTDNPKKFEVPSHQWVDLTDRSGAYGATVLTDCKNGSDKPDDNTLRLTLVRTPGTRGQLRRPGHAGFGPSRVRVRPGRARGRLAQGPDRLAGLPPQPASHRLRSLETCGRARQDLLAAQRQPQPGAGAGPQEGRAER